MAPLQINTGVSQEHLVSSQANIFWVKETHLDFSYRYIIVIKNFDSKIIKD